MTPPVVVERVDLFSDVHLAQMIRTLGRHGRIPDHLDRWQHHRSEDRDDSIDHQQFDQGEALVALIRRHPGSEGFHGIMTPAIVVRSTRLTWLSNVDFHAAGYVG